MKNEHSCSHPDLNLFPIAFVSLIPYLGCLPVSYAEEVQVAFSFDVESEANFRGRSLNGDVELWSYVDYSWSGISAGLRFASIRQDESESNYDSFVSYSYATEQFYFTAGFNFISHFDIDESEVFFEVYGREDFFGISPSVFLSQELDGSRSYVEVRISQDVVKNDWLLNPHASLSFGDYYSDEFERNHFALGFDLTKRIEHAGVNFYITASLNAIKPLNAIDVATSEDDIYFQSSLGLLFRFN